MDLVTREVKNYGEPVMDINDYPLENIKIDFDALDIIESAVTPGTKSKAFII